jgi:mannose-6-phosphate isomerase-like protein (cupin superfamily)
MSTRANQSCNSFLEALPKGIYPDSAIPLENALSSMDNSSFCCQCLMPLKNSDDFPEVCDVRDVAIAVLEGEGRLSLQGEEVSLKAGKFVFIPANTPHRLQSTANLILFLSSYEADSSTESTAWIFDL